MPEIRAIYMQLHCVVQHIISPPGRVFFLSRASSLLPYLAVSNQDTTAGFVSGLSLMEPCQNALSFARERLSDSLGTSLRWSGIERDRHRRGGPLTGGQFFTPRRGILDECLGLFPAGYEREKGTDASVN